MAQKNKATRWKDQEEGSKNFVRKRKNGWSAMKEAKKSGKKLKELHERETENMLATEKVVDKFDKLSLVTFVRCCPMCLNSLTVIILFLRGENMITLITTAVNMMESNDERENDDIDEIDNGDRSPDLAWQYLGRVAQVFAVPS